MVIAVTARRLLVQTPSGAFLFRVDMFFLPQSKCMFVCVYIRLTGDFKLAVMVKQIKYTEQKSLYNIYDKSSDIYLFSSTFGNNQST